jgi:phosphate transport system substrate-binding protein
MMRLMRNRAGAWLPVLLLILLAAGVFGGCGTAAPDGAAGKGEISLRIPIEDYPNVDGSTVTIPLSEAVAAAVTGLPLSEARQYILHNKTHAAYENLIAGRADIIFVTSPSAQEFALAAEQGVALEIVPIVSEGFVFLTGSDNPVKELSLEQIRDIYAGRITNWKDVGGADKAIAAYQRPENSGSQTGMLDLVIGPDEIMTPPMGQIVGAMGELLAEVAAYRNEADAIGYSYYYYVTDMWNGDRVKLLAVDGVHPDKKTISEGAYPLRTSYYAVLRVAEPEGGNVRKLLEWILSEQGQQVMEEAGYVKLGE